MHKEEFQLAPNNFVFCDKRWRLAAGLLGTAVLLTFLWALYLLGISLEQYRLDDYSISHHPAHVTHGTAGLTPVAGELAALQQKIMPALVHVHGMGQIRRAQGGVPNMLGSGVIVHPSGYVVTAAHAVANHPRLIIDVATANGPKRYPARLIKLDPERNLALLKLRTQERFLFLKLADTRQMQPGEPLYAFGYGLRSSVIGKQGSLLQRGLMLQTADRNLSRLFQTDAVYSWEQTGGALVTGQAQLAGVNLALNANGQTLGYAIPSFQIDQAFGDELALASATSAQVTQMAAWPSLGISVAATGNSPNPSANPSPGADPAAADLEHANSFTISGQTVESAVGLALLGLASGIVGGLVTMGGGIFLVSGMLIFFGYGMALIRPVSFITNVFTYGAASIKNRAAGLIMWDRVLPLIPWAVAGVILGYMVGSKLDDQVIAYLLGFFALLMAAKTLHEIFHDEEDMQIVFEQKGDLDPGERVSDREALGEILEGIQDSGADDQAKAPAAKGRSDLLSNGVLGVPMGLVSGLLGISGGVIEVPLQRHLANISLQNAIANSSVMVFWASLAAAVVALVHGSSIGAFEWQKVLGIALVMIPSSYIGGMLGAKMLPHLPTHKLRWVYVALMLLIGVRMLFGQ
ncbi:MAG: TSUP family transporter [Gammaproteobacteria bacterium SHHR-1]|uniref:TSUP family transporter n=1 Tax=Magnetovirga frankeli TaxID=947516 RepID=UPI001292FC7C|nr:TSUP family transporter [gamma proteobacterium SS-5]